MRTFNVVLFGFLALLFVWATTAFINSMFESWESLIPLLVLLGALLMPGTFLLASRLEKRGPRIRVVARRLAAGYNGVAALLLAWHGITVDAVVAPVDKFYALIFAVSQR